MKDHDSKIKNSTENKSNSGVGGLFADIKPNGELKLKDSDYVIRNIGFSTIRVHVCLNNNKMKENE